MIVKLPNTGMLVVRQNENCSTLKELQISSYQQKAGRKAVVAMNCCLFDMTTDKSTPYGTLYIDKGHTINKSFESTWQTSVSYDGKKLEVDGIITKDTHFVISGFSCLKNGYRDIRKWEKTAHLTTKQRRSMIGQDADGHIILAATDELLTAEECQDLLLSCNCVNAIILDGGGSVQMQINGKDVVQNTGRKIANALVYYDIVDYKESKEMIYPCKSRRITSPYGKRNSGDGFHDGVDFGALVQGVQGDEIVSADDGVIAAAYSNKTYGNLIIINSSDGKHSTVYGHLKEFKVTKGQKVSKGQLIGLMGNTGESSGTHLHFEVRTKPYDSKNISPFWSSHNGEFYSSADPMKYLQEVKEEVKVPVSSGSSAGAAELIEIAERLKEIAQEIIK